MTYEIVYGNTGGPAPMQVKVLASNPTVLDVMEQAVIDYGNDYTFTVSYTTSKWGLLAVQEHTAKPSNLIHRQI